MIGQARLSIAVAALGFGLLPGANALAQDGGWYSGVFGGVAKVDIGSKGSLDTRYFDDTSILDDSSLDDSDPSFGVQVGYRFTPHFAVEAGYVRLGEAVYEAEYADPLNAGHSTRFRARFRSSGLSLAALGTFPLNERFDLHGRAGAYYADTRYEEKSVDLTSNTAALPNTMDGDSIDVLLGIGATWNMDRQWALRAEYQKLLDVGDEETTGESDVDLLWFGVLFR